MAISDLTEKILSDAKQFAVGVKDENDTKVSEIEKSTTDTVNSLTKESEGETKRILADNEERVISSAKQEVKIELDRAKRNALEATFVTAYKELVKLSDGDYEVLVEKLLKSLPAETKGKLSTSTKRRKSTETALGKVGLSLTIETDDSIEGGFTVEGSDYEYNYTFSKILENKKQELEIEVANILFG